MNIFTRIGTIAMIALAAVGCGDDRPANAGNVADPDVGVDADSDDVLTGSDLGSLDASLDSLDEDSSDATGTAPLRGEDGRWSEEFAARWWDSQQWPVGFNYIPANAINQLEMWQEDTFDPDRIELELTWAADRGFNTTRVFLHNLLWEDDPDGFIERIEVYLEISDRLGFRTMFVLFDHVWGSNPQLGEQPAPVPGIHNSGWVQSPSEVESKSFATSDEIQRRLEDYVKGIVGHFADDPRVWVWDTVNEPGSSGIDEDAQYIVAATFEWIQEVNPSQPATASIYGVFNPNDPVQQTIMENSDVLSFHSYFGPAGTDDSLIDPMREVSERPMICTEYLGRTLGSTFEAMMPHYRDAEIGAIHWGWVAGKTQTIYAWGSPEGAPEPAVWFHDVLREDGTPWSQTEVEFLRTFMGAE